MNWNSLFRQLMGSLDLVDLGKFNDEEHTLADLLHGVVKIFRFEPMFGIDIWAFIDKNLVVQHPALYSLYLGWLNCSSFVIICIQPYPLSSKGMDSVVYHCRGPK